MLRDPAAHVAAILNAGYLVRHYSRPSQRRQQDEAMRALAAAVRAALDDPGNDGATLRAVADALKP